MFRGRRTRDRRAQRALGLAFGNGPVETILFAWIAVKSLRVGAAGIAITSFGTIFDLALDVPLTHGDRTELVATNPAIQDFLIAPVHVEIPDFAVANDGKRERPISLPHLQELET